MNICSYTGHRRLQKEDVMLSSNIYKDISINKYILEDRQTSWNNSIGNKLIDIKPTLGEYQSVVRNISWRRSRLVATHHSLYVTSFWNVSTLHK